MWLWILLSEICILQSPALTVTFTSAFWSSVFSLEKQDNICVSLQEDHMMVWMKLATTGPQEVALLGGVALMEETCYWGGLWGFRS